MNVTWPKEENIRRLVSQSAGLFVYPVTAIRYIDGLGEGRSGFEERLRAVLELGAKSMENPFSALDQLYTLIMRQIPEGVLSNTMSLLQLYQHETAMGRHNHASQRHPSFQPPSSQPPNVHSCCFALGLSLAEFHVTISNLFSVLEVRLSQNGQPEGFRFYHKSFIDFLLDPRRSKEYFILSPGVHQHSLEMIVSTLGSVIDADAIDLREVAHFTLREFFLLVEKHNGKLEENILLRILQVYWDFWCRVDSIGYKIDLGAFMGQIPKDWHDRIVCPYYEGRLDVLLQKLARLKRGSFEAEAYILGQGDNKCLLVRDRYARKLYKMLDYA